MRRVQRVVELDRPGEVGIRRARVAAPEMRRAAAQPGASLKVRLNLAMALGLNGKMDEAEQMMRRDLPPDAADRNLAWLRARAGSAATDQARTWGSLQGG